MKQTLFYIMMKQIFRSNDDKNRSEIYDKHDNAPTIKNNNITTTFLTFNFHKLTKQMHN